MKKTEFEGCPQWLLDARTIDEEISLEGKTLVWHNGTWLDGIWYGGIWHTGDWLGGTWRGGVWKSGYWWRGKWYGGIWMGGVWKSGVWKDKNIQDRVVYMSSLCGLSFSSDGYITGYRTTLNGHGRYNKNFIQTEGKFYESDCLPADFGTSVSGTLVTSAARAWALFGIGNKPELWEVKFRRGDLIDCDGEKARIRGGIFKRVEKFF